MIVVCLTVLLACVRLCYSAGDCFTPENDTCHVSESCPPWHLSTTTGHHCVCKDYASGRMQCIENSSFVAFYYCATVDPKTFSTVVGLCPFANYTGFSNYSSHQHSIYIPLPNNVTALNSYVCTRNRTGYLCGNCDSGTVPALFSYDLHCMECNASSAQSIATFALVSVGPVTAFFFTVILVLRVSVTSPPMSSFILFAHIMLSATLAEIGPAAIRIVTGGNKATEQYVHFLFSIYGVWNLDFFRFYLGETICLRGVSTLDAVAFEYIVALFPILLISVSWIIIEVHHRSTLAVRLLKPFGICVAKIQKIWNVKTSVIHVFVSFIVLSYAKLASVSFSLLRTVRLHNPCGLDSCKLHVFYNGTMEYFSSEHQKYAIPAIVVLLLLLIPPLILLLYPVQALRKFFENCYSYLTISAFCDVFQGFFKDGTNKTRDYRWFAGMFLIVRLLAFGLRSLVFINWYLLGSTVMYGTIAFSFEVFRPYKTDHYNHFDAMAFGLLALIYLLYLLLINYVSTFSTGHFNEIVLYIIICCATVPLLFIIAYASLGIYKTCFRKMNIIKSESSVLLPDRIVNPTQYNGDYSTELTG